MRRNSTRFIQVSQPKWAKYHAKGFRLGIPGSLPNSIGEQSVLPVRIQMVFAASLVAVSKCLTKQLKRKRIYSGSGTRRYNVHFESMVRGLVGEACDWDPHTYSRRHREDRK